MSIRKREIPPGLQVAPSLLAADFARLGDEIRSVEAAGVKILHLDVMDGSFVPNITFGPPLVKSVRAATDLFLDTHLMISNPLGFLEPFARSGADLLTLHAEAISDPRSPESGHQAAEALREARRTLEPFGCGLGLSFRPASNPIDWLRVVGAELDLVLVMTVEPGFGGQSLRPEQIARIEEVRHLRERSGWRYRIEADGGIGPQTVGGLAAAGVDILVAGTAVFGRSDRPGAVAGLLAAAGPEGRTVSS